MSINRLVEPLTHYLTDSVNEIMINKPQEVWVESGGVTKKIMDENLTFDALYGIAMQIANHSKQELSEKNPILSAALPSGERVQILIPNALEQGRIAFAIRKPNPLSLSLSDMESAGSFSKTTVTQVGISDTDKKLSELLKNGDTKAFLALAVQSQKNIIISGGTSSGKTTFANALVKHIPLDERIITIEDTREAELPHENKLHLLGSSGNQGVSEVTFNDLLRACLRLNPTRILMSELRGSEAFDFLRAVNSGHPGAITTMHADSPKGAVFQLTLMVLQAGLTLTQEQIRNYILSIVDVIVQCKNVNGKRIVTEIFYEPQRKSFE